MDIADGLPILHERLVQIDIVGIEKAIVCRHQARAHFQRIPRPRFRARRAPALQRRNQRIKLHPGTLRRQNHPGTLHRRHHTAPLLRRADNARNQKEQNNQRTHHSTGTNLTTIFLKRRSAKTVSLLTKRSEGSTNDTVGPSTLRR